MPTPTEIEGTITLSDGERVRFRVYEEEEVICSQRWGSDQSHLGDAVPLCVEMENALREGFEVDHEQD